MASVSLKYQSTIRGLKKQLLRKRIKTINISLYITKRQNALSGSPLDMRGFSFYGVATLFSGFTSAMSPLGSIMTRLTEDVGF